MKEKFRSFFTSENLKGFSKKVFTKKKVRAAIVVIILLCALRIGFSLIFEVKGTVLKVDTNSIVVTNFLGTKTVNTGNYPLDNTAIAVGEKIEITKNISGDVISIKRSGGRRGIDDGRFGGQPRRSGNFGQNQDKQVPGGKGKNGSGQDMQGKIPEQGQQGQVDGTSGASLKQN